APLVTRAAGGLAQRGQQKLASKKAIRNAPTAQAIKASSKAAYKASEDTGAILDQPALNLLRHDIRAMVRNEDLFTRKGGISKDFPRVRRALQVFDEHSSGPMTMNQAQRVLKAFRRVAGSTDPDEARIGMKLIQQLDDFMD